MKLIRCHIENFGVLSDFDLVFDVYTSLDQKTVISMLLLKLCSMDSLVQVHEIS